MQVFNLQPVANSGGGSLKVVANFDLELSGNVRLYGLRLMATPEGRRIVYAPNGNGGRRLATFSPQLAAEITKAAIQKFEGHVIANVTTSQE